MRELLEAVVGKDEGRIDAEMSPNRTKSRPPRVQFICHELPRLGGKRGRKQ